MDIFIFTLGVIVAFAVIYYFYRKQYKPSQVTTAPKEAPIKTDGEDLNWDSEIPTQKAYKYLMHVNHSLRVNSNNTDLEQVFKVEELIDELRNLLMIMEDSKTVLKWKVSQICVDFLPKLVNRYNVADDKQKKQIIFQTVDGLRQKVLEIKEIVVANKQEEFEHYANTLNLIMKA